MKKKELALPLLIAAGIGLAVWMVPAIIAMSLFQR
jgi:hypothetical protein